MYGFRGLGVFDPPVRPVFIDPGYPPDARIVAQNTAANDAYQRAVDIAQAQNNFDQCESNARNANSQSQFDQVMAACRGQAAQQAAADNPILTYYTPGQPLSYSSGGPAIAPPQYTVPDWALSQPAFNPPVLISPTVPVDPSPRASVSGSSPAATAGSASPAPSGVPADDGDDGSGSPFATPADVSIFDRQLFGFPVWMWAVGTVVAFLASGGGGRR